MLMRRSLKICGWEEGRSACIMHHLIVAETRERGRFMCLAVDVVSSAVQYVESA